jgi:hypothetical protein
VDRFPVVARRIAIASSRPKRRGDNRGSDFGTAPRRRADSSFVGDAACDSVKPWSQCRAHTNRRGLAGEQQENSLRCVFGVMAIAQDLTADAKNHRSVALDQDPERFLRRVTNPQQIPGKERGVVQVSGGADGPECAHFAFERKRTLPGHHARSAGFLKSSSPCNAHQSDAQFHFLGKTADFGPLIQTAGQS